MEERSVTIAATQMCCSVSVDENMKKAESLVRIAASRGAQIVLLQDYFQYPPFEDSSNTPFHLSQQSEKSNVVITMSALARELHVVLPISFLEKYQNEFYTCIVMIDADGSVLGTYRQVHVTTHCGPSSHPFSSSEEGFKVWKTAYGCIGVGLTSDQWYPEAARSMVLQGAEILLYPSSLGCQEKEQDFKDHWQRTMQGHAAANMIPVVSSNRVGKEKGCTFFGSSFIAGTRGEMLKIADRESEGVLVETFRLHEIAIERGRCGLLRDRRPRMYQSLSSRSGRQRTDG